MGNLNISTDNTPIGANLNLVEFNFIGTDHTGNADLPNNGGDVSIFGGANNNTLKDNVVGGSFGNVGVGLGGSGTDHNTLIGNDIGVGADGVTPLSNAFAGIAIGQGAEDNTVGGATVADRNIVSDTAGNGIDIDSSHNLVEGNYIGINAAGLASGNSTEGISIAPVLRTTPSEAPPPANGTLFPAIRGTASTSSRGR